MLVWCIVNVINTLMINCSIKFLSSKLIINFNWDSIEPGEPRVGLSKCQPCWSKEINMAHSLLYNTFTEIEAYF